jgi:hypothetical protein
MDSFILTIHKKGDKTDCSNYRSTSLLSTTYNILSNVLLSRLTPYVEEIIGDHHCGFRHNKSILIIHTAFVIYLRKNGNTMEQCISYL